MKRTFKNYTDERPIRSIISKGPQPGCFTSDGGIKGVSSDKLFSKGIKYASQRDENLNLNESSDKLFSKGIKYASQRVENLNLNENVKVKKRCLIKNEKDI